MSPESRERAAATLDRSRAAHELRTVQSKTRKRGSTRRRAIVLAILVALVLIAVVALPPLSGHLFRALADANPDLVRIGPIADAVGATIGDRPDQPAGTDPTVVEFKIEPGVGSGQITQDLYIRELVTDRVAFMWVLVTGGVINNLEAGTHELNRTMTPRQVSLELAGEPIPGGTGVPVVLSEGLRLEQISAYLQTLPLENLDAQQFYDLATTPPQSLRDEFPWLSVVPEGRSVEGFLASGVFDVDPNIDAQGMVELLLRRWENSPSFGLIAQAQTGGKDFYKAVVLASIVEREATLDDEKPPIAGVYQNRLDGLLGPTLLNADPTIIYAKDTMLLRAEHISQWPEYFFWTLDNMNGVGSFDVAPDLAGFQTYRQRGLPPWPICTPDLASLQAALNPDTADGYLFFVAKGDGSDSHAFAKTYEGHQQNIDFYWRGGATREPALPTAVPAP
ncbi:MAG: endolytic transglycosylase MltG [Chloroflexota bacterium]